MAASVPGQPAAPSPASDRPAPGQPAPSAASPQPPPPSHTAGGPAPLSPGPASAPSRPPLTLARPVLLEGALGERLKAEYGLRPHPEVAWAALARDPRGREALTRLWREYAALARARGLPFLATTPTRRANRARMQAAGLDAGLLRDNVALLRAALPEDAYCGGLMGCYGEAYTGRGALPQAEARAFHAWQADALARAGADFLYAAILPTLPEALGLAGALQDTGLPYLISFMLRRDGRLPDGTTLHDALSALEAALTRPPLGYMANCVHPDVAAAALSQPCNRTALVRARFVGLQPNASPLPPEALEGAARPMTSSPAELAAATARLMAVQPLRLLGGCCGTDGGHLAALADLLLPPARP